MKERRDKMKIIVKILSVIEEHNDQHDEPAGKTRIVYGANTNFERAETYLGNLVKKGLVEKKGKTSYVITEEGREFLKQYKLLENLLNLS